MSNEEIILKYTRGEATLEETNAALKEAESDLHLDPDRNTITPEEQAATTVGATAAEANGYGLMDHGFSTLEKVYIINGHTVAEDTDMGNERAFVFIGGRKYQLVGTELQDIQEEA